MIILMKQIPLLVLERAIVEDVEQHRLSDATHGMLLLPLVRNHKPVPDAFRIAMEYRTNELTPLFMELIPGTILKDLADLPKSTRVPYTLFLCSDVFHRRHNTQLQFGHTAHALIQKFITTVRK